MLTIRSPTSTRNEKEQIEKPVEKNTKKKTVERNTTKRVLSPSDKNSEDLTGTKRIRSVSFNALLEEDERNEADEIIDIDKEMTTCPECNKMCVTDSTQCFICSFW